MPAAHRKNGAVTRGSSVSQSKRTVTYLVLVRRPHPLHNLLSLCFGYATLLSQDLHEGGVYLARHVSGVATDVEIGFLRQEVVNFYGLLLETVLNIDLLWSFPGECSDKLELVAENLLIFLGWVRMRTFRADTGDRSNIPPIQKSRGNLPFGYGSQRTGLSFQFLHRLGLARHVLEQTRGKVPPHYLDRP